MANLIGLPQASMACICLAASAIGVLAPQLQWRLQQGNGRLSPSADASGLFTGEDFPASCLWFCHILAVRLSQSQSYENDHLVVRFMPQNILTSCLLSVSFWPPCTCSILCRSQELRWSCLCSQMFIGSTGLFGNKECFSYILVKAVYKLEINLSSRPLGQSIYWHKCAC